MAHLVFETSAGFCGIAWSDAGITGFRLPDRSAAAVARRLTGAPAEPPAVVAEAVSAARRYFAGEVTDFAGFPVEITGPNPFFRAVYAAVRRLGWGETTTYGALARELGAGPEAARDVGQAMAQNPVPLIIPCHRVLAAGNRVGGFSAPGGATAKARMLALEGVIVAGSPPAQRTFAF